MNAIPPAGDPIADHLDKIRSSVEGEFAARAAAAVGLVAPYGFRLCASGLYRAPPSPEVDSSPIRVSDPFEVAGECEDGDGGEWAVLIKWTDRAGHSHAWSVPHRLIRAMRGELAAELASNGLHVEVGEEQSIRRFLGGVRHANRLQCVDRAGWHLAGGPVFVLPGNLAFGPNAARVVLQAGRVATGRAFKPAGNLENWQRDIARFAVGNDRLALFLSAAFTGPLLDVVSEPSGGLHLVGKSQSGKSTAALVAASAWGRGDREGQVRQWRGTANGVEGIAAEATDTVLVLDEIGQADPKEVGEIVYMLANGAGKVRANQLGGARDCRTWRVLLLSTGEVTLEARMGEVGKRAQAGLGVRLVNLPADAGAGMGAFQVLHGMPSPAALAEHLRDAARMNYGTAAPAFLERLVAARAANIDKLRSDIGGLRTAFIADVLPDGADGQVRSVAGRFGLIAAAGEMATAWGVLPWPEGMAASAAGAGFLAWLRDRGGSGAGEDNDAIRAVRAFLSAHGESRFTPISHDGFTDGPRTINRAGFRRIVADGAEFLIMTAAWRDEVCKGMDAARAARALAFAGFLKLDGNRSTHRISTPEGRVRVYVVPGSILS